MPGRDTFFDPGNLFAVAENVGACVPTVRAHAVDVRSGDVTNAYVLRS